MDHMSFAIGGFAETIGLGLLELPATTARPLLVYGGLRARAPSV
jgi:hypothetical protein